MLYIVGFGCDQKIFSKSIFHSAFIFSTCCHHHSLLLIPCGTQGLLTFFHLALSKACCFASFQLHTASCSSHFLILFQVFFVYLSSLHLQCSSPVRVIFLHLVVYLMYGQSNTIFFPLFLVQQADFLSHNSSFEILTGYMTFKYVIGISLQMLEVNYLSVQLFFCVPHLCNINDLTFLFNNQVFILSEIFLFLQTGYNFTEGHFAFSVLV